MKKRRIKWNVILGVILLLITAGVIWQWGNIEALVLSLRYNTNDLNDRLKQENALLDEELFSLPGLDVNPLTEEQRRQLQQGTLSQEEAIDIMIGGDTSDLSEESTPSDEESIPPEPSTSSDNRTPTDQDGNTAENTPKPDQNTTEENPYKEQNKRISALIAQVYVLRDSYIGKLDGLIASAEAEFNRLPPEERTATKRNAYILACIDAGTALEASCDGEINAILSELTTLLTETGGDLNVVSSIRATYAQQKALKKAYYMSL